MEPGPRFVIDQGYALYDGPTAVGGVHAHAAFQIAIALAGEVVVLDGAETHHHGVALVIPPMTSHRMLPMTRLRTFYVEPRSAFADRLRGRCGGVITEVPELRGLDEEEVRAYGARRSSDIDPRLVAAMDELASRRMPMPALAASVGLSPQRLRALARSQLGMPLASWHTWQCLSRAAQALREGQTLADAAITGGFADQAHFTRRMREMMGLTPATVLPLLTRSAASGDVHRDRAGHG